LDQAIANHERAVWLDPQDALAYANLGIAYANRGDGEKAVESLEKALELGLPPGKVQEVEAVLEELHRRG